MGAMRYKRLQLKGSVSIPDFIYDPDERRADALRRDREVGGVCVRMEERVCRMEERVYPLWCKVVPLLFVWWFWYLVRRIK